MRLSKLLVPAAFAAAMVFPVTSSALLITITGGSWSLGTGWGPACTSSACNLEGDTGTGHNKVEGNHTLLNMDWTIDGALSGQLFSLNVGDTQTVNFGAGKVSEEDNTLDSAETDYLDIAGILNLNVQSGVNNAGTVTTAIGTLGDNSKKADLSIVFAPVVIDLEDGTALTIDLSDPSWNCNAGHDGKCDYDNSVTKTITATFTLTQLDQSPLDANRTRARHSGIAGPRPCRSWLVTQAEASSLIIQGKWRKGCLGAPSLWC